MSTEFYDAIAEGFAEMLEQCGVYILVGSNSKLCVLSEIDETSQLQDAGIWGDATAIAELLTTEAETLELAFRVECVIAGSRYRVTRYKPDPAEPTVRVGLKLVH